MVADQTAAGGEEYLKQMNFRTLVEWITAESLLTRAEDPLVFIRNLVEEKISQRPQGCKYKPEHVKEYLDSCYTEATAYAEGDENVSKRKNKLCQEISSDSSAKTRLTLLENLISASRVIAVNLDYGKATTMIIKEACRILNVERATLFILDNNTNELVLSIAEGAKDIRVPLGKGIAGSVGLTGECINISDAYSDDRFDPQFDKATGFRTNNVLCVPVKNGEGNIVGVMQAINSVKGYFSKTDEEIFGILGIQAGIALHNSNVHKLAIKAKEKVRSLLDIIQAMHSDFGIASLMFTINQRVRSLVDCDRSTLFLLDHTKNELWALEGEVNIRIPSSQGIAGAVAQTGDIISIPNAYEDPRFNKEVDMKSGYKTNTILCMALRGQDGTVTGVLQLINKMNGPFNEEDQDILNSFLTIAGPVLENSQLFLRTKTEGGTEFSGKSIQDSSNASNHREMVKIVENADEEEGDKEEE